MQKDRALFLYGFDINYANKYINFKSSSLGSQLTATLKEGNYTATSFALEVKRAMDAADGINKYTVGIDRSVDAGASNRLHISTNGSFLSILFLTGTNAANSPKAIMGYDSLDYTGSTSYSGYTNAGTILLPDFSTWDYLGPDNLIKNDGVKNVSASGIKETLVFSQMRFFQGQWKYIADFGASAQATQWKLFLKYAIKQLKFEFTPSIYEDVDTIYQCTLESTPEDGNGMGYRLTQMTGVGLYRFYDTGVMKFRVIPS
jgi:hypothetical protein